MAQPKDAGERLWMLAGGLAESIVEVPDQELLEDARSAGRDPKRTQDQVKGLLNATVLAFKKRRLAQAESDHASALAAMQQPKKVPIPADRMSRRLLLGRVIQRQPQLQGTLQFREFDKLTDEDVESMLQKLALLGVLDEE